MSGGRKSRKLRKEPRNKSNRQEQRRLPAFKKSHLHQKRATHRMYMSRIDRLKGRYLTGIRRTEITSWDTMKHPMALTKAKNSKLCKTKQQTIHRRRWFISNSLRQIAAGLTS